MTLTDASFIVSTFSCIKLNLLEDTAHEGLLTLSVSSLIPRGFYSVGRKLLLVWPFKKRTWAKKIMKFKLFFSQCVSDNSFVYALNMSPVLM